MKIKHFTHSDLDGIGCAILSILAFGKNANIDYCNYDNIDESVKKYLFSILDKTKSCDRIFITDISIDESTAEIIENNSILKEKVILIDHHKSAEWLDEKYDWCTVILKDKDKEAGVSLYYKFLIKENLLPAKNIEDFVESIRRYDTWEWKTKYNDIIPSKLNNLLYIYGFRKFVKIYSQKLQSEDYILFSSLEETLLEVEKQEMDNYIKRKLKDIVKQKINGYTVAIVFGERFKSELGDRIVETDEDIDLAAIIDLSSRNISYRTNKEDVDVSIFAQKFGGGGHSKASGSQINENVFFELLKNLFFND